MSSKTPTVESGPSAPEGLAPELREPYRRLLRVLRAMRGTFALVPVESDLPAEDRERVFERLERDLDGDGVTLRFADVFYEDWDPVRAVEAVLDGADGSAVVVLRGMERTPPAMLSLEKDRRPKAFARLNQAREVIEQRFEVPLIVWCDPYTYGALQRHAPDFFDHFTGLVQFRIGPADKEPWPQQEVAILADRQTRLEAPAEEGPGSEAAIRFYEAQLEKSGAGSRERLRALLGLGEALLRLRGSAKHAAAARGLEAVEEALTLISADENPEDWVRAKVLQGWAYQHSLDFEAACEAFAAAVTARRRLAASRRTGFQPPLADALYGLGETLAELGRREEAVAATREAVEIDRQLAATRPDAFEPGLANSLNNLGRDLSALGRNEEAFTATREAVEIYRRLAAGRPENFRPRLALSLNNLGNALRALGRREEALAASREAVEIYRRLTAVRHHAFEPDLAGSLNNLGNRLSELGRREEALAASREAAEIYRRLATARPDAFKPELARSLNNLGSRLSELGRREEALAATREAVEIYRRLAAARPDAFEPDLAGSLHNQGLRLSDLGRREKALEAAEEAVRLLEPLFRRLPVAFREWMGIMVGDYRRHADAAGQEPDEEFLAPIEAALASLEGEASSADGHPSSPGLS